MSDTMAAAHNQFPIGRRDEMIPVLGTPVHAGSVTGRGFIEDRKPDIGQGDYSAALVPSAVGQRLPLTSLASTSATAARSSSCVNGFVRTRRAPNFSASSR